MSSLSHAIDSEVWAEYKKSIIDRVDDFSCFYTSLENRKPSTDGWVTSRCPFHEDGRPSFAFERTTGNWKCHAGCGEGSVFDYVAKQNGGSFKDALLQVGDEIGVPRPASNAESQTTYNYTDENGALLYQVVRAPDKRFYQRRPNGKGGWINNLRGVQRVLYRLSEIGERPDEVVYVAEGEKDADRLANLGLLATTNSGGAGKWKPAYADVLAGRDVIILPDNDDPGRGHAVRVADSLEGKVASVRIVHLPDLPDKGDVSDWLDAGGTREALAALVAETPAYELDSDVTPSNQYPVIETFDRPLREIMDDGWEAMLAANDPPQVFNTAGCLSRLRDFGRGAQIEFVEERAAISFLARVADWVKTMTRGTTHVKPPKEAAHDLIVNPHAALPVLDSVITTPVFDEDWRLITRAGYHPESRLWLDLPAEAPDYDIPTYPGEDDVRAALSLLLDDLLVDFPFTSESDRAHAVAAILLPFARRMFSGPTPIHLLEAPTPGSGKSLLAELILIIALGFSAGCTTLTTNEEESRKKLTAILSRGASVISIDNLQGGLWSAQVAAAITTEVWEDRLLGKTQMVSFPNRALWLVSANNPKLSMEIARRCVRIRIDPGDERPWQRTGFKHDPIREWALQHRHELVRAVLTLIQDWIVSDCPHASQTMGSFETWSRVIGGMVGHFGLPGFLDDLEDFYESADSESGEWRAFVSAWWDMHQDRPVSGSTLLQMAINQDLVPFAYAAKSEHAQRVRFGKSLSSLRDRRFGDCRIVLARDAHKKTRVFRLVRVEEGRLK